MSRNQRHRLLLIHQGRACVSECESECVCVGGGVTDEEEEASEIPQPDVVKGRRNHVGGRAEGRGEGGSQARPRPRPT